MGADAFLSGWAGGFAGVLASHPLDTLRTRQAVTGQSVRQTARELIATGPRNLCEHAKTAPPPPHRRLTTASPDHPTTLRR